MSHPHFVVLVLAQATLDTWTALRTQAASDGAEADAAVAALAAQLQDAQLSIAHARGALEAHATAQVYANMC